MIWGAHGAQNPSPDGVRWHDVTERDNGHSSETAGQTQESTGQKGAPPAGFEPALPTPEDASI
jgi:hypothetical protein